MIFRSLVLLCNCLSLIDFNYTTGPFYHSVWDTLIASGVGETLTYKELAKLSGNPNAARAAGSAVKSHCLPILVPCHRVVKSSSSRAAARKSGGAAVKTVSAPYEIGQYSGGEGTETKQWLLEHERKMAQDVCVKVDEI